MYVRARESVGDWPPYTHGDVIKVVVIGESKELEQYNPDG
jgi:hypothetical protein